MTRDEFLDIMGGIDEELIGKTLDVTRAEVIKPQRGRSSVWRYVTGFAACIAILVTVFAVGFNKGIPTQPDDSSGSAGNPSSVSDIIRGWDPEKLVYSDAPVFGGNMRVSVAELDGITAELILHNIKKEAGTAFFAEYADSYHYEDMQAETGGDAIVLPDPNYDYTHYVGAEDIVLYVHDDKGRRFIETSVVPHSYNGMELIPANCLFDDCTRLYNVEGDYVLMQYADDTHYNNYVPIGDHSLYLARFYKLDLNRQIMRDENGIYTGGLISVKVNGDRKFGDWEYGFPATRAFEYIGSGDFYDRGYNNQNNVVRFTTYDGINFYTTIPEQIVQMIPYPDHQP